MTLTEEQIDTLRHMVGAQKHIKKRNWGFRNHFCSTPGSDDDKMLAELAELALVIPGARGANNYWHCTREGCEVAGLNYAQQQRALYDK